MNSRMTIKIKKPKQSDFLIDILLWVPVLNALLTELMGFPRSILYACDAAWVCLLCLRILQTKSGGLETARVLIWVTGFLVYTAMIYCIQYQSVLYYLWGMRNAFRYYAAFAAVAYFWREQHFLKFYQLLDKLFWINFAVSLIQYFFLDLDGDFLGGIFGTLQGVNGHTVIFLTLSICQSCVFCFENQEKLGTCVAKCAASILLAAIAELKFFFAAFVMVLCMSAVFTHFSWKKLAMLLGAALGVMLGSVLLAELFNGDRNWFSLEWMYNLSSSDKGYTSSGDLNRLNAIPRINELWLQNGWQRLFGLGLGNCDTASYAILNTPFFEAYGDMHYTWISYAMIYLETGWIGLIFYWGFFVLVYFGILRIERRSEGTAKSYCRISRIMAVLCVVISIYNSSLRTEAGYMAYFVLAIPFALSRGNRRKYLHG